MNATALQPAFVAVVVPGLFSIMLVEMARVTYSGDVVSLQVIRRDGNDMWVYHEETAWSKNA